MKNCVNTSHKEFKELARKLDIEDSFLRTIIYEFQNADPTNVNVFPSEEYIIQKLTGINPITSPAQMALWEKYYFEVLKFDSEKEFDAALENAKKFFPSRAITTWKTRDGKIALKVAEPNNYRENLYEEDISEKNVNTKQRDLKLEKIAKNLKNIKGNKVLLEILKILKDSEYSSIIELMTSKFGDKKNGSLLDGISFKFIDPFTIPGMYNSPTMKQFDDRRAYYDASTKTIYINIVAEFTNGDSSAVLLHELMHAMTVDRILSNPELKAKFEQILEDYQKEHFDIRYANHKEHRLEEFIANIWSDPKTIENLKNTKSSRNSHKTLWQEIKDAISNIFSALFKGIKEDSLFAEASIELIKLLESPAIIKSSKSFKEEIQITYTPKGQEKQSFTVVDNKIYNKEGKEVYSGDNVHRNKILANVAVKQGNALVIPYGEDKYVVYKDGTIVSGITGKIMKWQENHGIRKYLTTEANKKFESKNDKSYSTNQNKKTYSGLITSLKPNQIFVFGSNTQGRHGAGAAKTARDKFGAKYGQAEGIQGQSYAIITKDLTIDDKKNPSRTKEQIIEQIHGLYEYAKQHPDKEFLVAYSKDGKNLNHYSSKEMAKMFASEDIPSNIIFEEGFYQLINENIIIGSWKKQTTSLLITSTNNTAKKAKEIEITEIKEDTSTLEEPALELTPINIYAKTGENKNLSNFAPRPFDLNINSSNNIYLKELAGLIDDLGFNNVESAFHAAKILFTKEGIYWVEASGKKVLTKKGEELLETLMISSGDDALTTGRNIKGLDRTTWDNNSFNIMKSLLRISFSENENSLQELLATGESPLTHTQAKGRWKEDFPKALMEVREEFKRYKEIKPELIPEKTEYDEYIEESVKLANQISTLLNSEVINATDVREFADQVVYWISDEVTEILQNPSQFIGKYPNITEDNIEDIKNKSRIELIQLIGISNLLSECKKQFDPKHLNIKNIKAIRQALIIQQCWDGILHIASSTFADMEKFSIINNKNKLEVLENIDSVLDEFSDIQDKDNFEEIGNKQEHWQVEFRSIDVLNSMSQQVRFALSQCYILDNEGNRVRSIFNIAKRVSPRDAVNSILKWTQGSLNLKEMTNKLKEQLPTNPWLQQIINRLEDISGNQTDFQSQFFSVFNKHYQSYYTVIKEKTKSGDFIYKSIPINTHPALKEATDSIIAMYTVGEHPLFLPSGVLNNSTYKDFKEIYEEIISLRNTSFDQIDKDALISKLKFIYNALGYNVTEDIIEKALNAEAFKTIYSNLTHMIKVMDQYKDRHDITPFTYKTSTSILGNVRKVLSPITDKLEDTMVSSFNDNGKMYQSYVTPSYMTKLMTKFKTSQETFENFLKEEFGKYEWFNDGNCFTDIREGWKNPWLHRMTRDPKARESFEHKVQLSFNKHNYMKTMNEVEYTLSILTEYWSESTSNSGSELAWFRVPMLSNKPSSEFIKFYSERGPLYKETLVKGFYQIALQELSRIQTVRIRNYSDTDASFIKSFDKNGRKFMFLDFLNDYLDGDKRTSELGKLLNNKISGKELSAEDNNKLVTLLSKEIRDHMDQKAENLYMEWKNSGVIEGAKKIKGIGKTEEEIKENIINFIWNDTFASMNIIELTITDPAFYKDAEDLQKRFAQIHAPGVRGNTMATDYKGNPVTDGKHRTIYLTDFDNFKSNIIENLEVVFDRKIQEASEQQKPVLRALKKNIIEQFESINVADAQAYSSPTSYRKKAFVFGKWNKKFEEIYEKLKKGEYNYSDLQVAFQPLKPFVYSQIEKSSKVDGPITKFKVPVQHKNSEYLLIMADAILQGENTGRPNLLRAVFDVMEKSTEVNPIKGIDTVQFESAVKSGLHGAIDIKQFQYTPGGELAAKELLESLMYNEDGSYNETFVHEIPYEDYCLQQEVPSHFKDHSQAHGSQIRYIIPSDLDTKDSEGNDITYNVEGKKLTASEFKQEYENTIADNIKQSIEDLSKELNLTGTRKEKNVSLSKLLTREILNNPRYGTDLLLACSLDENGEFRIPLGDPIQSKRVEQLLNSIIKNKINKQTIAGGPIVQVSNFGTSKELNIRFKSKDGGLLMTRSEWEANKTNHSTFKEYIKDKQEGIAYFECFAPIGTDAIFEKFQNEDGSIDIKAIEALDPELLKLVGYRIPTEDKYSCVPLKIVGFLPREAGDGIMLPNDITLLSGSDFDVKIY